MQSYASACIHVTLHNNFKGDVVYETWLLVARLLCT